MKIKENLAYSDVLIMPQYSDIRSRSEVSLDSYLGETKLSSPIISSPMDTITEEAMMVAMSNGKSLSVVHRYNSIEAQVAMIDKAAMAGADHKYMAAAIGTGEEGLARARAIVDSGVQTLCIDVAHGHHILVKEILSKLWTEFGSSVHIIAGNVATRKGYEDLARWGANSVRCNVGSGSICSTKIQTGHGVPGLETIFECAKSKMAPIIADGGICNSGDIVKALAAGADFVMLGSLLSGTDETPGNILMSDGKKVKSYRGMASKDAQMDWRGRQESAEGIATVVPYKGSVTSVLDDLERGVRSGLSYSGARTIKELQGKAQFVRQTGAGQLESSTHILSRKQ